MAETHSELVKLAVKWLFHDHPIVTTEIACVGEEPDALGFRGGSSTLVECKAHRSDFLADKKKVWRRMPETALGDCRYYCAPKGLISVSELPESWGLLEPSSTGRGLRVVAKPAAYSKKSCHRNEMRVLMSILRRVGQSQPEGVSIRCYTYKTKKRATVSIATATEDGY